MIPKSNHFDTCVSQQIYNIIYPYAYMSTTTHTTIDDLFGSFYNVFTLEQDLPLIQPLQANRCFHKCRIYTIKDKTLYKKAGMQFLKKLKNL